MHHELASAQRFSARPDIYNAFRIPPPKAMLDLVKMYYKERVGLVVDLGSGTGLSTRYWKGHADHIVGVEPSNALREFAESESPDPSIVYLARYANDTGLKGGCADVVSCYQSLHWMEPDSTFEEIKRLLKPKGLLVAGDYDWPPATGFPECEIAWQECIARSRYYEQKFATRRVLGEWPQTGHLSRMKSCGKFAFCREVMVFEGRVGTADELVGALRSQGGIMLLLKMGISESELAIDKLIELAHKKIGSAGCRWVWGARIRIGIVE